MSYILKSKIAIPLLIISGLVIFYFFSPYEFSFFPKCPFYKYTGLHCAGCGTQRALYHLVHFEVLQAIRSNILIFFWLGLAMDYLYKNAFTEKEPLLLKSGMPWLIMIVIVIYMILRNIPYPPFEHLAPVL